MYELILLLIFVCASAYINLVYKRDMILLAICEFFVIMIGITALIAYPTEYWFIIGLMFLTIILSLQNMFYYRLKGV